MPTLRRYTVVPRLPAALEKLREIADNLWWSWAAEARELFIRIDGELWEHVRGNPIELLASVEQRRLDELAADDAFLGRLESAYATLQRYLSRDGWFKKTFPETAGARIAYFSMEYGLHECLPIYSGGLGVLAGDHLKTASDLGLPLVGIGLAYAEGYFRQALNRDGLQQERYPINDWNRMPVSAVNDAQGKRLVIDVTYPDQRVVHAQLWKVQVGRVPLFLLDTNVSENRPEDRGITGPLYGGDSEFRVRQEIMLGIGGVHALEAMSLSPTVCHMNEGHSAFLAIERIGRLVRDRGATFSVAHEACSAQNVFTTHTPVPAGLDVFNADVVKRYLEPYRAALGLSVEQLLALGGASTTEADSKFSMPVLAIRTSDHYNAVSSLHGEVSRKMWSKLWPDLPEHEIPIQSVTNGIHTASWVSDEMGALFTRYIGPQWSEGTEGALWSRVFEIPDSELWEVHEHRRHRLVQLCRRWLRTAAEKRGDSSEEIAACEEVLDSRALTIGFARRFATYKRATLLFRDVARVTRLLGDVDRPVQLVFAGKAHPQDKPGKELIRSIVHAARDAGLSGKVVFIEDYDMRIARALVSGVDVWLNTPRRPLEASGTSGMKAAANGALNCSVLDGWWAEAWAAHGREVGWAIGRGEEYADEAGDAVEAELLYDLLERDVVPTFFDREEDKDELPRRWIKKMKSSIAHLAPAFNTARMVREYTERFYVPSHKLWHRMVDGDLRGARELWAWKERVRKAWTNVRVASVSQRTAESVRVGDPVRVSASVELGDLTPEDVVVELYYGPIAGSQELDHGRIVRMKVEEQEAGGRYRYMGEMPTRESGAHAYAVRVMPYSAAMSHPYETSLIRWD